jgi:N-carbamoyl-L-amino-acid hydrolase
MATDTQTIRADRARLWQSLMDLAAIGATAEGGSHRLALTDADLEGQELFCSWAAAAGCVLSRDAAGNLFATRVGSRADRPAVVIGSHLDTQPNGGRFDGPVGVLSGLEVVRTLNDAGIETESPLVVVSWTNEEGARFPTSLTGSSVFAGRLPLEEARALPAIDGPTFGEELDRLGVVGTGGPGREEIGVYLELHIEQNTTLEQRGVDVGIVERGQGIRAVEVTLVGSASHAGTTPMHGRRDALVAAARIVERANAVGLERDVLVTVGRLDVQPNSRAVIPGQVQLVLDIRDPESARIDEVESVLEADVRSIAEAARVEVATRRFLDIPAVTFDVEVGNAVRRACDALGLSSMPVVSGAAHDAMSMAAIVPTALVFIPCRDGVSHRPDEYADADQVGAGCDAILNAALALAGVARRRA